MGTFTRLLRLFPLPLFLALFAFHSSSFPFATADPDPASNHNLSSFHASISAPWFSHPVLETLELVASHSLATFHALLPVVCSSPNHDSLLSLAIDHGLPHHIVPLIRLSTKLGQVAPRIHALFSTINDHHIINATVGCPSFFVQLDLDIFTCDLNYLRVLLEDPSRGMRTPIILRLDKYFYNSFSSQRSLLLFANPLHHDFPSIWKQIISLPVRVALRYLPLDWRNSFSLSHSVPMLGYHTHLQIKNTEYLVTDDRQSSENFMPSSGPRLPQIKPDNFLYLPSKVIHNITSLEQFVELSKDYPRLLPNITYNIVSDEQNDSLNSKEHIISNALGDVPLTMFINNQVIPTKSESTFNLLAFIEHELRLFSKASEMNLDWNELQTFFLNDADAHKSPIDRFDYCSLTSINKKSSQTGSNDIPSLIWLNDLEHDKQYAGWPRSLNIIMQMLSRGLQPIARNLFNVVAFLDLSMKSHRQIVQEFGHLISQNIPIRFGIVPLVTDSPLSLASTAAIDFILHSINEGPRLAVNVLDNEPNTTPDSIVQDVELRNNIHKHLLLVHKTFEVSREGDMLFNGRSFDFSPLTYQRSIGELLQIELEAISRGIFFGTSDLTDSTDFGSYLCKGSWKSRPKFVFEDRREKEYHDTTFLAGPVIATETEGENDEPMPFVHVSIHGAYSNAQLQAIRAVHKRLHFSLEPISESKITEPTTLIVNGRLFRDIPSNLSAETFEILILREARHRIIPLLRGFKSTVDPNKFWRLSSLWWWNKVESEHILPKKSRSQRVNHDSLIECQPDVCLRTPSNEGETLINLTVYLHPISEQAQYLAPILLLLHNSFSNLSITIIWRTYAIDKIPNRFTRFHGISSKDSVFSLIPPVLYTLALDIPPSWVITAASSKLDLDNLIITTNNHVNVAEFELEALLVEGHAEEIPMSDGPRGMQLTLSSHGHVTSTIVMANLGYFQFKATPGVWSLGLRQGRTTEIYESFRETVVIDSIHGTVLFPKFKKRKDKEDMNVIDTTVHKNKGSLDSVLTFLSQMSSLIFGKRVERIHVFSVASGHLYERFLAIMMQSVVSKTTKPVTFWLLGDFLSPSFKKFLPYLSKDIGFDYQLVSYAWPDWLREQGDKQRKIWGYKILFLDVLFPLENGPDRIIFVDADQVVRTDLAELMSIDLEGKVYGFTPFCDSRDEIEGYRFWRQGFWQSHLRGKPYHISALYVVDLDLFRKLAAGDILRAQYQALSADPNSLANLDQDLPNYLQHMLEIHSLPQDWLWCETWCSDESLKTAKTIDLCNNPMTREPKLDRARRLLPEWSVMDERAEKLRRKYISQQEPDSVHEEL